MAITAALQGRMPAFRRRDRLRRYRFVMSAVLVLVLGGAFGALTATPSAAQTYIYNAPSRAT